MTIVRARAERFGAWVALDDVDERCEAMLLLRYGLCDDGLFSVVDALSAPTPRGQAILRRMVGWLLTRLDVAAGSVGGLVVHSRNEALRDAVVWASERIPAASIYPNAAQPTVSLDRARFARMLAQAAGIRENVHSQAATPFGDGRMATVLDVRGAKESDLDEQGRDMFRLRPRAIEQRKPTKGPRVAAMANSGRSGAEVYWLRGA